jgi:peptidoglycan-N-acetylglucosamine deacetylase
MNNADRNFVMTTSWDDGHPLDLRVAALLAMYRLTGTFYVPRSGQRPVMNPGEILGLSKAFEIGGHSLDHVTLDQLSDVETSRQLTGSREWIQDLTGTTCRAFCFPGGKFARQQLKLVRDAGYQAVRTVELLSTAAPRRIAGVWVIPTTVQAFPHGPGAYIKNAAKRFSVSAVFTPRASLFSRNWVALAKDLFLRTKKRGGVFHLWGHSWEIAEHVQWRPLQEFLSFASANLASARCLTNGDLCEEMSAADAHGNSALTQKSPSNSGDKGFAARALENERP